MRILLALVLALAMIPAMSAGSSLRRPVSCYVYHVIINLRLIIAAIAPAGEL